MILEVISRHLMLLLQKPQKVLAADGMQDNRFCGEKCVFHVLPLPSKVISLQSPLGLGSLSMKIRNYSLNGGMVGCARNLKDSLDQIF